MPAAALELPLLTLQLLRHPGRTLCDAFTPLESRLVPLGELRLDTAQLQAN